MLRTNLMDHDFYIKRCFELALPHLGNVSPNPVVGAVIVENNSIIGESAHLEFGGPHAEVNAVNSVENKNQLAQSTLYINLEPCCYHGKTPACTDLILKNKIKHVVISCLDPNSKVSGKGIEILKKNGVQVTSGILEDEAKIINKRFFTFHNQKRPYIILKWAQSNDGYIANKDGQSKWISNSISRMLVHKWRSEEASIMVGTNTAKIDNPALTVRDWSGKNPVKIVIDKSLKLNKDLKLFTEKNKLIVFNEISDHITGHAQYIKIDFKSNVHEQILNKLYQLDLISLIIEGGAYLLNSFIEKGLWDEARVFTGPEKLISGIKAPKLIAHLNSITQLNNDLLKVYYNK